MKSPHSTGKPSLESLLRLKRAERPAPEFWQQFESELRRKQLAATIEPKPWWLAMATLSRKAAPLGLPVGAAAALTLAAISFQTGAWTSSDTVIIQPELASLPVAPVTVINQSTPVALVTDNTSISSSVDQEKEAPVLVASVEPVTAAAVVKEGVAHSVEAVPFELTNIALASLLPGIGLYQAEGINEVPSIEQTPSQRYISENLAAAQRDNPELRRVYGMHVNLDHAAVGGAVQPAVILASNTVSKQESESELTPISPRNARLLALVNTTPKDETSLVSANIAREQAVRLNDDVLYASATRLGVVGDRLSISF